MLEILINNHTVGKPATIVIPGWDGETFIKSDDVTLSSTGEYLFPNTAPNTYPDHIRIPYSGTPTLSLYPPITTVTMKCRVDKMLQGNHCILWSRYLTRNDANSYAVAISPALNVTLIINNKIFDSTAQITLGEPFELVTRREAANIYIYLNGVLVISYAIPAGTMIADATWDWVLGSYLATNMIVTTPNAGRWDWRFSEFIVETS